MHQRAVGIAGCLTAGIAMQNEIDDTADGQEWKDDEDDHLVSALLKYSGTKREIRRSFTSFRMTVLMD